MARKVKFDIQNPKTEEQWGAVLASSPDRQGEYDRWRALGGEEPISLPEDFKKPDQPLSVGSAEEMYDALAGMLPKAEANYGNDDRPSYERERQRLSTALSSDALSEGEKRKVRALMTDLDDHYEAKALDWYSQDLKNAKTPEEVKRAQAAMDELTNSTVDRARTESGRIADIMAGGDGFGSSGFSDPSVVLSEQAKGNLASPILENIAKEWNAKTLGSTYDQVADKLQENATATGKEQMAFYDNASQSALAGLRGADARASDLTRQALEEIAATGKLTKANMAKLTEGLNRAKDAADVESRQSSADFRKAFEGTGAERDKALEEYLKSIGENEATTKNLQAGVAKADQQDIARQLAALDALAAQTQGGDSQIQEAFGKYKERAEGGMSPAEQALLEIANRSQARALSNQQKGLEQGLRARGAWSGGAAASLAGQSAAALGSDRVDAQLRALMAMQDRQERGIAGMASTAAQAATQRQNAAEGYMSGTTSVRTLNDALDQYNVGQKNLTDKWRQEQLAKMAQEKEVTRQGNATQKLSDASLLDKQSQEGIDARFGREKDTTSVGLDSESRQFAIDSDITGEKTLAADREANRAAGIAGAELDIADKKTGLIGTTEDREDKALREWLALQAEKANLGNLGAKV